MHRLLEGLNEIMPIALGRVQALSMTIIIRVVRVAWCCRTLGSLVHLPVSVCKILDR